MNETEIKVETEQWKCQYRKYLLHKSEAQNHGLAREGGGKQSGRTRALLSQGRGFESSHRRCTGGKTSHRRRTTGKKFLLNFRRPQALLFPSASQGWG